MNLLFAAPDRDLLAAYRQMSDWTVQTAFDGIRAMACLEKETPDAAVVDAHIWRVGAETIMQKLNSLNVPTVLLTDKPPDLAALNKPVLPDTFLTYPFLPEELRECVEQTVAVMHENRFFVDGLEVDPARGLLAQRLRLTKEETRLLAALAEDTPVRCGALYVGSLNAKLASLSRQTVIRYVPHGRLGRLLRACGRLFGTLGIRKVAGRRFLRGIVFRGLSRRLSAVDDGFDAESGRNQQQDRRRGAEYPFPYG